MTAFILTVVLASGQSPQNSPKAEVVIGDVQRSHIEANVPAASDFKTLLERDLGAHFSRLRGRTATASYELLRDGPTQSGVSYPKYYAWVTVRENGVPVEQGAVRVAAVDRQRFEVTNFLTAKQVEAEPEMVLTVFPSALADAIKRRAQMASR